MQITVLTLLFTSHLLRFLFNMYLGIVLSSYSSLGTHLNAILAMGFAFCAEPKQKASETRSPFSVSIGIVESIDCFARPRVLKVAKGEAMTYATSRID